MQALEKIAENLNPVFQSKKNSFKLLKITKRKKKHTRCVVKKLIVSFLEVKMNKIWVLLRIYILDREGSKHFLNTELKTQEFCELSKSFILAYA